MATQRENLGSNAPISEALVDIQVGLPPEITVDDLARFGDERLKGLYPKRRPRSRWEGVLEVAEQQPRLKGQGAIDGWLFYSQDERQIVQFRLDGFTLNRLRPYSDWGTVKAEAKLRWEIFRESARPTRVKRLALRYINHLRFPAGRDLDIYLTIGPRVPPGLPQVLSNFFHRLEIPDHRAGALLLLSLATDPQGTGESRIILDIDVSSPTSLDPSDESIWTILDTLRDLKNDTFFSSLTDEALQLLRSST